MTGWANPEDRAEVPVAGNGDQPEPVPSELGSSVEGPAQAPAGGPGAPGAPGGPQAAASGPAAPSAAPGGAGPASAPVEGQAEAQPPEGAPAGAGPAELAEALRQRDEYLDALRRLQAEFDNYRKRVDRQRREVVDHAASSLVQKLLPVLDTADLALAHGGGEDIKQLASALFDVLAKEGLERIDPEGQLFDPQHHDAVAHDPAGAAEEGQAQPQVSEVLRAGYRWRGRVLRPAMVKVRG